MNKLLLIAAFCLPLRNLSLTSGFGYRIHPVTGKCSFHSGIDLGAHGDTVFAVLAGHVSVEGYDALLGVNIHLQHRDFESVYGHLSQVFVLPGDSVLASDKIGITGMTGRVTGEHLHFSIRYHGACINPLRFLLELIYHLNQYKNDK